MLKYILKTIFFVLLSLGFLKADTIIVDTDTNLKDILSDSKIYIDKTQQLEIDDIKNKKFEQNRKDLLSYGYAPNINLWIKFTLHNSSDKKITKVLEYDNSLTTHVSLYIQDTQSYKIKNDGLFQISKLRDSVNPIFQIELEANESKVYYIKAGSMVTTLIAKLNLWDQKEFYKKEIRYQFVLALFFGAMSILALYNLFIYFITKDISYLYYVVYILGIILHHLVYVGIAPLYLFDQDTSILIIKNAAVITMLPIYALAFFTKSFLHTEQYPVFNKILNFFLIFVPIFVFICLFSDVLNRYRTLMVLLLFIYLLTITIYAVIKKNKQAYYILFGWCVILIAILFMYLSSAGIFNIYSYFDFVIELGISLEALIFSIALAAKIKFLQNELVKKEKEQKKLLKLEVEEKTKELKELNENLEQMVKDELEHIQQMERKLFESEKMAAMGEMMGNIAHQWRQPLSIISTESSSLLLRKDFGKLDDASFKKSLEHIISMTKHLSQTINDFRDYIKGNMERKEFVVSDCINKVLNITSSSLDANFIKVVTEIDDKVLIDNYENALIQSLVNIINNAKDALKELESVEDRFVFITVEKLNSKARISIKDSAGGIPENIKNRIFEPYFTTKHNSDGTGLGLHMTYNMVKTMNGTIEVKNQEFTYNDKNFVGVEFILTL